MRIIRWKKSRDEIQNELSRPDWRHWMMLAFDERGRDYYRAIHGQSLRECTFAIEHEGQIVGIIECDNAGAVLGRFGFPVEPCLRPELAYSVRRQAVREIGAELLRLANELMLSKIMVRSAPVIDPDGLMLSYVAQTGALYDLELRAVADLSLSEENLFDDLRKGHRQQVRWGQNNLKMSFVDSANPDERNFESYRALHAEVAGRTTRGPESWRAMFQSIAAGRGDLILCHLDGKLVSGTLILDGHDTAYYASGAYDRTLFDKPLGHAPLFEAILRAKRRGRRAFDVGEVSVSHPKANEKERSIGYFKRGFTSRVQTSVVLSWLNEKFVASDAPSPSGEHQGVAS